MDFYQIFVIFIMLRKLAIGIRDLTLASIIFGAGIYGYVAYTAKQNQQRYLQSIKSQNLRDASRLSNQSFGISWGFQADDTIMARMDSGDLLFMKYQCEECITPQSMINCYLKTSHYLEEEFHSVGFTFRDQNNLYVLYNELGETKTKSYCELVSLPYIKALTLQKSSKANQKIHRLLRKQSDITTPIYQNPVDFANRIINLLYGSKRVQEIQDLQSGDQRINIRTDVNRKLSSL